MELQELIEGVDLWKKRMWRTLISNQLCYYNGFIDVYATSWNNGWNTRNHCFNFNLNSIL